MMDNLGLQMDKDEIEVTLEILPQLLLVVLDFLDLLSLFDLTFFVIWDCRWTKMKLRWTLNNI